MPLRLRNLTIWNTGEQVDLVVDGPAARGFAADEGTIDLTGVTLAPAFGDPHVHFRDPGQRAKETMATGCAAAAAGGYGLVLVMPNTVPAMDGAKVDPAEPGADEVTGAGCDNVIDYLQRYGEIHGVDLPVRYDLCVAASTDRAGGTASRYDDWAPYLRGVADRNPQATRAMREHPVTAFSDDGSAVPDGILDQVLANAKRAGVPFIDHCEHHDSGVMNECETARELGLPGIPEGTELAIVARDIDRAAKAGVHLHLQHLSTAVAVDAVRRAKAAGLDVTCETAPHYLALDDTAIATKGTLAKMNPPLRGKADRDAVRAAVADGTIDMLATDHAPHTMEEKARGMMDAPNGIIGLDCAYAVARTTLVEGGVIDDRRLIELMAVNPYRFMGHEPADVAALAHTPGDGTAGARKVIDLTGGNAPDADLVLLDTHARWTVDATRFASKARNTPYDGMEVVGRPLMTIVASRAVHADADAIAAAAHAAEHPADVHRTAPETR